MIIVLQQKEHDVFTRNRNDLIISKTIGLTEALCGFQIVVRQLDGRDLVITNDAGDVIKPGMIGSILLGDRLAVWLMCLT